jgi:putative ABC transport system ATP-binding protein
MIALESVYKSYQTKSGLFSTLKGVSLEAASGEFVAVVGPSGSGKSTLINMITGIDCPNQGDVRIMGQSLNQLSENDIARWRGQNVGVVFQFLQLLPNLTVLENVMLPMNYAGTYKGARRQRALELLETVAMADAALKYPSQISGGQQQSVAIARALANEPALLVGDEPTGNLDTTSAGQVFGLFERLVEQGKTIIMVTHDRDLARRVPRVVEMREGKILQDERVNHRLHFSGAAV